MTESSPPSSATADPATADPASRPAPAPPAPRPSLGRIAAVVVGSAVLPGSGHLAAGSRRAGRAILAVVVVLLLAAAVGLVLALREPGTAASLAVRPGWLTAALWGVPVLAAAWIAVVVHGAMTARPGRRGLPGRALAAVLAAVLVALIAVPAGVLTRNASVQLAFVRDVFADGPAPVTGGGGTAAAPEEPLADGRLDVLLIGSDAGPDRTGVRTDTVILASLDTRTGRTVLFTLPRNLERVPFTPGSVMAQQFPRGFSCGDECLLNAIYRWGEDHPALFAGDPHPGVTALESGVSAALGLPIDNYALVDLAGFEKLVDALGGVTIRVERDLPIGGLDAEGNHVKPSGYVYAGLQRMDGETALAYARSRSDSSDYERVQRQRCLLGALQRQADPSTLLTRFQAVAGATEDALETDIPRSVLPDLVKLAFKVKQRPVESLTFTPPLINVGRPDYAQIQALVQAALVPPAATPVPSPPPVVTPPPSAPGTATPSPEATVPSTPVPVDQVCSYS